MAASCGQFLCPFGIVGIWYGNNLERFLAITVAKLCSAILEVRLASYRLDGNILSCALYLNSQTWLPLVANFLSLWRYSEWQ